MRATRLPAKENNWRHYTPSGQKTNTGILKFESRNCVWTLVQANPRHLNCNVCSGKMFQVRPPLIYARTGQANRRKTDAKRRQNLSFIDYPRNYPPPHPPPPLIYARTGQANRRKTDAKRRQNLSFIDYRGNYHGPHGFKSPSASLPYQLGGGAISARVVAVACKTSFTVFSNSSKV